MSADNPPCAGGPGTSGVVRARFGDRVTSMSCTRLYQQHNVATDGTTTVVGEYPDVQTRVV